MFAGATSRASQALPSGASMLGAPVTLRFHVSNLGPADAANVEVRTTNIAHFAQPDESDCFWVVSRPSGDLVDPTLMALTLVIGLVPAGGEHTCHIRLSRSVRPGSTTFQPNVIDVGGADPNPDNDSATTTLVIFGAPRAIPAMSVPGLCLVALLALLSGWLHVGRPHGAGTGYRADLER
jgi:hypothetical protein